MRLKGSFMGHLLCILEPKNIFQSFVGENKPLMKAIYNKKRLVIKPFKFYTM